MDSIGKVIDSLSSRYENYILVILNAEESDTTIKDFWDMYSFKNLVKDATCNIQNFNDLMLTNRNRSFQNSCVIDTGLSDFHKITITKLRSHLHELGPKTNHYRDYKNFWNDALRSELFIENGNIQNFNDLDSFLAKCKNVWNRTAPLKGTLMQIWKSTCMFVFI